MTKSSTESISEHQHKKMLETPIPKLILGLSAPTVLSMLITVAYNTADTWFVSQIGTSASAAVGVVFSIMSIIQSFGFGLGVGAGSLISRRLGEKRDAEAQIYASSAFSAAIIVGLFLEITGLLTLQPLMRLLGATDTMLPYACDYARYILYVAPIMCASFVLNNILRAEGEPVRAMWGLCIGGILNVILDPILIFSCGLGISGAAIATAVSQTVSFLILLFTILKSNTVIHISTQAISNDFHIYIEIISIGLPSICRQGLASVASAALNKSASLYGDAAIAAITIANKVYLLIRNIVLGVGQGFMPVAGYNFGARNLRRTRSAFLFTCILGTILCWIAAILSYIFAPNLIGWFRDDPQVIEIGTKALRFASMVMPLMAYSTFVNQLYQCLGFKVQAAILASCRQGICFFPLVLILPRIFNLTGVQATQPASDLLTFFIAIPFQIYFFKFNLSDKTNCSDE